MNPILTLLLVMALLVAVAYFAVKKIYVRSTLYIGELKSVNLEIYKSLKQFRELSKGRFEKSQKIQVQTRDIVRKSLKQVKENDINAYRQIESLIELNSILGFNVTGLRGWAISPDAAVILYKDIVKHKPDLVLELGGGVSSIIITKALKDIGKGRLVSIDHEEHYAELTKARIKEANLDSFADVRVAPLTRLDKSKNAKWYDLRIVKEGIEKIDYLVVDGPPEGTNKYARKPAVPVLSEILDKNVRIFMDDSDRLDEKQAISDWLKLLKNHKEARFYTEKGTTILASTH